MSHTTIATRGTNDANITTSLDHVIGEWCGPYDQCYQCNQKTWLQWIIDNLKGS
jgi:hypothetical protein